MQKNMQNRKQRWLKHDSYIFEWEWSDKSKIMLV